MSGGPSIHMPIYWGDYLRDTGHLSAAEHGAYLLLLGHYWTTGRPLPDAEDALRRIARMDPKEWARSRSTVRAFFKVGGGEWRHKRVDAELKRATEIYAKRVAAGRGGGISKWGDDLIEGGDSGGEVRPPAARLRSQRLSEARQKARHTKDEWDRLIDACGSLCVQCGADGPLVKDHIIPIYRGGDDGVGNLQPLCVRCNSAKGADSTDHRPHGWRDRFVPPGKTPDKTPSKTPSERLTNGCQPQPHTPNGVDDDEDGRAGERARSKFDAATERVIEAAGADPDKQAGWMTASATVQKWLGHGADLELDVLPAVAAAMVSRRGRGPPNGPSYFDRPVLEARERRLAPLPDVTVAPIDGARNGSRKPNDFADRQHALDAGLAAAALRRLAPING